MIYNTLNGIDVSAALFTGLQLAGVTAQAYPVVSFSLPESASQQIGPALAGHFLAWSFFSTLDTPAAESFVERFYAVNGDAVAGERFSFLRFSRLIPDCCSAERSR